MSSIYVVSLNVENEPCSFFRIKVEFLSKTFSLIIIYNNSAFKGQVTSDYIVEQSKVLNLSEEDYIMELRKAMKILPDSNLFTFTYSISDDTFHIKKKIEANPRSAIKVKFCSIQLTQVDFATSLVELLDSTLAENQKYSEKLSELRSKNEMLTKGNELLHQQLKQMQETKNSMESVLYRQFLNLLNSKKQKIRQLEQKLGIEAEDDNIVSETKKEDIMETELYEAETDIDEEDEPKQIITEATKSDEVCNDTKIEDVSDVKKPWNIKDYLNSKDTDKEPGGSNVQRILNAMSFLDPTVPFVS